MLAFLFIVALYWNPAVSFTFPGKIVGRQICLSSDISGSPLPPLGDLVGDNKREVVVPSPASPLVERALDSALDFLQDSGAESESEEEDEFDMFEIYEESPEFDINYDLIKDYERKDAEMLNTKGTITTANDLLQQRIKASVEKWRKHENDVGSMEVQIAICNERVRYLTTHLLKNKADKAAKRGLDNLVTSRRVALNYLYRTDRGKAELMVKELGIRYRPPGQLWDKDAKYAAFKNTKSKFMKLRQIAKQERNARIANKAAKATSV